MRVYLVDGTNAVRRGNFDPRFPEMEQVRTEAYVARLSELSEDLSGSVRIEIFFDGPRRPAGSVWGAVSLRFPPDGDADEAILGTARKLLNDGRGAVLVSEDRALGERIQVEGGRVMGFAELERRLRDGRA